MLLVLAAAAAAGTIFLCLAFLLPTPPMREHVKNSAYVFKIFDVLC